jgi:hypothetical protein
MIGNKAQRGLAYNQNIIVNDNSKIKYGAAKPAKPTHQNLAELIYGTRQTCKKAMLTTMVSTSMVVLKMERPTLFAMP